MAKKIIIYVTVFLLTLFTALKLSIHINYADLKDYHSILVNFSGMIFTIMGIWIAFLYPNSLMKIVNPEKIETADFSEALEDTKRLESIVASVLKSALVVTLIMLFMLIKMIAFKTTIYSSHIEILKCVALAFTIVITIIQLEAVVQVIASNVAFINNLHNKREEREANHKI